MKLELLKAKDKNQNRKLKAIQKSKFKKFTKKYIVKVWGHEAGNEYYAGHDFEYKYYTDWKIRYYISLLRPSVNKVEIYKNPDMKEVYGADIF